MVDISIVNWGLENQLITVEGHITSLRFDAENNSMFHRCPCAKFPRRTVATVVEDLAAVTGGAFLSWQADLRESGGWNQWVWSSGMDTYGNYMQLWGRKSRLFLQVFPSNFWNIKIILKWWYMYIYIHIIRNKKWKLYVFIYIYIRICMYARIKLLYNL